MWIIFASFEAVFFSARAGVFRMVRLGRRFDPNPEAE
jgi:hypothetical protein